MSEIYFVDAIEDHGVVFVKKDTGTLVNGDEHDLGLIVYAEHDDNIHSWGFEPIKDLRFLLLADLMAIAGKVFELNHGSQVLTTGMVFDEITDDYQGETLIVYLDGHVDLLSSDSALEIGEKSIHNSIRNIMQGFKK